MIIKMYIRQVLALIITSGFFITMIVSMFYSEPNAEYDIIKNSFTTIMIMVAQYYFGSSYKDEIANEKSQTMQ